MKTTKGNISKLMSGAKLSVCVPTVISIIAIIISIRSCRVASTSLDYSIKSFQSERAIVLTAQVNSKENTFLLKPIDSSMSLQKVYIYFPSVIGKQSYQCDPPNFDFNTLTLSYTMQELATKQIPRKQGFVSLSPNGMIPVIIKTEYTAKSELFFDTSLYYIPVMLSVPDIGSPSVYLKGLNFVGRLGEDTQPSLFLDRLWQSSFLQSPS